MRIKSAAKVQKYFDICKFFRTFAPRFKKIGTKDVVRGVAFDPFAFGKTLSKNYKSSIELLARGRDSSVKLGRTASETIVRPKRSNRGEFNS